MKPNDLIDIIGEAADEHIQDAKKQKKNRVPRWTKWTAAAAAVCIAVTAGFFAFQQGPSLNETQSPAAQNGYGGHDEGTVFMSYAGPIFPLTVKEDAEGLTAQRNIGFDLSLYNEQVEDVEVWGNNGKGVIVTDAYTVENTTESDKTITAVYPIAGDLQLRQWPIITMDGRETEWTLYAGDYSGGFMGTASEESVGESFNLKNINSWEGYAELLADGSYLENAFLAAEELTQPVTVYELTNITDGGNSDMDAAALCMRFTYDPDKTKIMSYGFNGGWEDPEKGEAYRDFFIREGRRTPDEETKYLIVVGEDIESYTLQGYRDGSCTPGEEIDGAGADVERKEMTMSDILREIARNRYDAISGKDFDGDYNRYLSDKISFELYYQAVLKHFTEHGPVGSEPKQRYEWALLDELVNEIATHERILYLSFELTVPAGGSVSVEIEQYKPASFDFECTGSENAGIDGYDMVTTLGSGLSFSKQTAAISEYNNIEIVRQNFGFDLENGINEVSLDVNEPHYYLEVRKKAEA